MSADLSAGRRAFPKAVHIKCCATEMQRDKVPIEARLWHKIATAQRFTQSQPWWEWISKASFPYPSMYLRRPPGVSFISSNDLSDSIYCVVNSGGPLAPNRGNIQLLRHLRWAEKTHTDASCPRGFMRSWKNNDSHVDIHPSICAGLGSECRVYVLDINTTKTLLFLLKC